MSNQREIAEALGALIGNTRRIRRKLNLVEVAEWLEIAERGLGSLRKVGQRIGLSGEMLREFAAVNTLSPKVKKLVAGRKIDHVDIAYRISTLPLSEQFEVARLVAAGELSLDDVRAIVTLRRSEPNLDIRKVVNRVRSSRNIKEYVAFFPIPPGTGSTTAIRSRFAAVVGKPQIRSLTVEGALGTLVLNSEGRKRLNQAARNQGVSKRKLIDRILRGE